jgi:hypothetical protein
MRAIKILFTGISVFTGALFFAAWPVIAAEISFDADTGASVAVGQRFSVRVVLNASDEDVNAVGGTITYPTDLLELAETQDANSIVSLWVDRPQAALAGGVVFSGITPGGYEGKRGLLLSLAFTAKKEGQGTIAVEDAQVLLNDGEGTSASLTTSPFPFAVSGTAAPAPPPSITDREPPESFVPQVARDQTVADGKWFVAFSTQDKGSGMDHYEVRESRQKLSNLFVKWSDGASPYILQDQELRSIISVKAVDKAGNVRVEKVLPLNPLPWYEDWGNWVLMILAVAVLFTAAEILWRKRSRK